MLNGARHVRAGTGSGSRTVWTAAGAVIGCIALLAALLSFQSPAGVPLAAPLSGSGGGLSTAPERTAAITAPPAATPSGPVSGPVPPEAGPWRNLPQELQRIVKDYFGFSGAAGMAVAVGTPEGRFLSLSGYSDVVNRVPLKAEDRFAFRSITKSFVGSVVLQLVDEGKIRLDDPVGRYVAGVPRGDSMTVRMALAMRTGLAEYSSTPGYSALMNRNYNRTWTDRELLQAAFAEPLAFEPGTGYLYSNTNTVLLGEIIRSVTGNNWDEEVQSRILDRLDLPSTVYPAGGLPDAPRAEPYQGSGYLLEGIGTGHASLYSAAGGMFGDIADLLRWGSAVGSAALLPPPCRQPGPRSCPCPGPQVRSTTATVWPWASWRAGGAIPG